jgi:hypothetical protein
MDKTTQKHVGAKPLGAKVRSATRAMALDLGQDSASVAPSLCVARDSSSLAAHLLDPVYAFTVVIFVQKPEGKQFSSSFGELNGAGPVGSLMF